MTIIFSFVGLNKSQAARFCTSNHDRLHYIFNAHRSETIATLAAGNPWEVFRAPLGHDPGVVHSRMYRIKTPVGSRLIKVESDRNSRGSDQTWFVHNMLHGMLLAEQVGGPRVLRAGQIHDALGFGGFFVEMEEIFAGQKSFTLKGRWQSTNQGIEVLMEDRPGGSLFLKIAKLFARAIEQRIAPDMDIDFIFSENDVRWIDTVGWTYSPEYGWSRTVAATRYFVTDFLRDKWLGEEFLDLLYQEIEHSRRLTLLDKIEIRRSLSTATENLQ